MPILSASDLARLSATFDGLFDTSCTIRHQPMTKDSRNNPINAGSPTETVVPCMVNDAGTTAREGLEANRVASRDDRTILLPIDAVVRAEDEIVADGTTYQVVHVPDDISYLAVIQVAARVQS